MKKIKKIKYIISAILVILLLNQTLCVWGAEDEWYSLHEVNETQEIREKDLGNMEIVPYARYIMGTSATIKRPSSNVIWMRCEVYCTETMSKITTVFTLQKKVGNSWVDVGQGTVSETNTNSMYKTMEATGVSSGTYRCVTNTQVISKTGYSETSSAISGVV